MAAFHAVLSRGGSLEQDGKQVKVRCLEAVESILNTILHTTHACNVLQVGSLVTISSKEELASAESLCDTDGKIIMDSTDWRIIPAGNGPSNQEIFCHAQVVRNLWFRGSPVCSRDETRVDVLYKPIPQHVRDINRERRESCGKLSRESCHPLWRCQLLTRCAYPHGGTGDWYRWRGLEEQ